MYCLLKEAIFFLIFLKYCAVAQSKIIGTVVVYRHGDRNPVLFYPNDPYGDPKFYPTGKGQLIQTGIVRQYQFGKWLRQRYNDLLPKKYNVNDIWIRSTDVDRTLMSAQSNLNGLYSFYQPIPVHTVEANRDKILNIVHCPLYDKLYNQVYNQYFVPIDIKNKKLYENLSNNTGININNTMIAGLIYDTLYIQNRLGYSTPEWAKPILNDLSKVFLDWFLSFSYTPQLIKLRSGLFLNNVIEFFESKLNNTRTEKMLMYSGHDLTISTILKALGYTIKDLVFYADSIIFDLNDNGIIDINYRHVGVLKKLPLEGCLFNCSVNEVKATLNNYIINEQQLDNECKNVVLDNGKHFENKSFKVDGVALQKKFMEILNLAP